MQGTVVSYTADEQAGIINARDGKAYRFALTDWIQERLPPEPGIVVEFEIAGTGATRIRVIGRSILL